MAQKRHVWTAPVWQEGFDFLHAAGWSCHVSGLWMRHTAGQMLDWWSTVLSGDKSHIRPCHRFAYGFTVICIVLVALEVRFHIARRHQSYFMSEFDQLIDR